MSTNTTTTAPLHRDRHIKYWRRCHASYLPSPYTSADSTRMFFACFILSALDLLDAPLTPSDRPAARAWVLSLQHPDGGFCGSPSHAPPLQPHSAASGTAGAKNGGANLAATFCALILLGLVSEDDSGDDGKEGGQDDAGRDAFAGVRRGKMLRFLRLLQREDGSFGQNLWDGEPVGGGDTRHSYMASCVRWMVRGDVKEEEEEEDIDLDAMVAHIRQGMTFDGGLAEDFHHESHAGYTYCSIAALSMLDRPLNWSSTTTTTTTTTTTSSPHSITPSLAAGIPNLPALLSFLSHRQFPYLADEEDQDDDEADGVNFVQAPLGREVDVVPEDSRGWYVGWNGRVNKKADACYAWWVSGTLNLLNHPSLVDIPPTRRYLLNLSQHPIGGFPKAVGAPPDLYHSYLGLAALATMAGGSAAGGGGGDNDDDTAGLKPFDAGLCCSVDTTRKIERAREGLLKRERRDSRKKWEEDGFWG